MSVEGKNRLFLKLKPREISYNFHVAGYTAISHLHDFSASTKRKNLSLKPKWFQTKIKVLFQLSVQYEMQTETAKLVALCDNFTVTVYKKCRWNGTYAVCL